MIQEKFALFCTEEIRSGNERSETVTKDIKYFLSNYQEEEKILRSESSFIFESVDLLVVKIHKTNLK